MDFLDRMLGHDCWATSRLLVICRGLDDARLDLPFDIGHRTLRATLDHMIFNVEAWTAAMAGEPVAADRGDVTLDTLSIRHERSQDAFASLARRLQAEGRLDGTFVDAHGVSQPFGAAIAHVVLHDAQHRAEVLHILERLGVPDLTEGDPLEWDYGLRGGNA